jgi:predicted RNA-binding Zn-ribbon protein involved in translation (DUF1610 family)
MNNNKRVETKLPKLIHFLICESCFWCASRIDDYALFECPTCNTSMVKSMPGSQLLAYG